MEDKRSSWIKEGLAKLIPSKQAEETRADLREAAALLDGEGVERKELKEKAEGGVPPQEEQKPPQPPQETAPEPQPEDGDVVAQVADKLVQDVTAAVQGDYSQLTEDKLRALLIDAMQPADEAPAAAPPPQGEEMQMAEDKSNGSSGAGITEERAKALLDTLLDQTEEQGEIAKSVMEQSQQIGALSEAVEKTLTPKITELLEWKAQIERRLAMSPRASEDDSTVIPSGTAKAEDIREEMEKGLQGEPKLFLGHIPVKSEPK